MVPLGKELLWADIKQKHSDRFRHIQAYSGISYPGIIQIYSGIFRALT